MADASQEGLLRSNSEQLLPISSNADQQQQQQQQQRQQQQELNGPSSAAPQAEIYAGPKQPPLFRASSSPPASLSVAYRPPPDIATSSPRHGGQPFSEIPISPARGPPSRFSSTNGQEEQQQQQPDASGPTTEFVKLSSQRVLSDKKLANALSLPFGALVSPYRDLDPPPPVIHRKPSRCQNCGGYPSVYSKLAPSSGQWECVLCQRINSSDGEYKPANRNDLHNWPELVSSVVEYVDAGSWRPPGFVPVADAPVSPPVVLVLDESLDETLLRHLQSSLHSFLDALPSSTRIGIVTYGKTVSIYDLSESSLAAADVLPGKTSPSSVLLKTLIYGTGIYLAPVHSCLQIAHTIVSSLRPYAEELREVARPRCLGTAVEVALALVQGPAQSLPRRGGGSSRLLVCAAGPNTLGPGSLPQIENHPHKAYMEAQAIKRMDRLGRDARMFDTTVDIFCAGTCPVSAVTLEPLAKASGGIMFLHDDFGEAFGVNLQRSLSRAAGYRGVLEVRCSDGIGVATVIGPGQEAKLDESFKSAPAVALRMQNVGENHGFAMSMQLTRNLRSDSAYFQFVSRYTTVYQTRITTVVTVRLPVTSNPRKYLQSCDTSVVALLIAKRTALLATSMSEAAELQESIDERLKDICSKFGSRVPKTKALLLPKEISRLPELLFHLRRGPLLGSIVGHEDERWVLRSIFLQASYDLSLRMLVPRLLMYHEGGAFEEVPAYNLAMQSETALVLDHGTDVYIWMGYDLCQDEQRSASAFAACKTLVQEITEGRFPAPRMLTFKEGSSQARYLNARLIPAHDDPPYEQEARFAQLQSLKPEQRAALKIKFVKTDEPSLSLWMKGLKLTTH